MLKVNRKSGAISLTRGDSAYLTISLTDNEGNPIDLTTITPRCQVRTKPNTGTLIFEGNLLQENGELIWYIRPEDTADLDVKEYFYDVQVEYPNGDIFTPITSTSFVLTDEVTYDE